MKKLFSILTVSALFFPLVSSAEEVSHIVISQVQIAGETASQDFIELFNPTSAVVDLSGWKLRKRTQGGTETSIRVISEGKTIPAFGYFLWANSSDAFAASLQADESSTAALAANNSLALLNSADEIIDQLAWGAGHDDPFAEGLPLEAEPAVGQSFQRIFGQLNTVQDTDDNLVDFILVGSLPKNTSSPPNPPEEESSEEGQESSGSETDPDPPPSDGSSALTFSSQVIISEFLPNPEGADSGKEWVELFSPVSADLSGWKLDDEGEAVGSSAFVLPPGTTITANQYLVILVSEGKFALNNSGGDSLRLLWPNDQLREAVTYSGSASESQSYTRLPDGNFTWTSILTPGAANQFNLPEPEEEVEDEDDENVVPISYNQSQIYISEILPNPQGPDSGQEWVELINLGTESVYVHDWILDDGAEDDPIGASAYQIQSPTIAPGDVAVIMIPSGKFAMNNSRSDTVRLFDPNKILVSTVSYQNPQEGLSFSLVDGEWHWLLPSPDQINTLPEPIIYSDEIVINELFPEPEKGVEEFIELKNFSDQEVDLAGWVLSDLAGSYTLPSTILSPGGLAVIYKSQSKLSLNNYGLETVSLINPVGEIVHLAEYEDPPKNQSFNWAQDSFAWSQLVTPGEANRILAGRVNGAMLPRTGAGGRGLLALDAFVLWPVLWYIFIKLNKRENEPYAQARAD